MFWFSISHVACMAQGLPFFLYVRQLRDPEHAYGVKAAAYQVRVP